MVVMVNMKKKMVMKKKKKMMLGEQARALLE